MFPVTTALPRERQIPHAIFAQRCGSTLRGGRVGSMNVLFHTFTISNGMNAPTYNGIDVPKWRR